MGWRRWQQYGKSKNCQNSTFHQFKITKDLKNSIIESSDKNVVGSKATELNEDENALMDKTKINAIRLVDFVQNCSENEDFRNGIQEQNIDTDGVTTNELQLSRNEEEIENGSGITHKALTENHVDEKNSELTKEDVKRKYKCLECEKSYARQTVLWAHKNQVHKEREYSFCDQCTFRTKYKVSYKRHVRSVHEGAEYPCDKCEYVAKDKSNLGKHMKSKHEGIRYPCDKCEHQASDRSNLTKHKESKHHESGYSCEDCDHKSKTQEHLKRHQDSMHKRIRYSCNQCAYTASKRDNLNIHKKSEHEGIRYSCTDCEYKAMTKKHLKRHHQAKHGGVLYSCDKCTHASTRLDHLNRHVRRKHSQLL